MTTLKVSAIKNDINNPYEIVYKWYKDNVTIIDGENNYRGVLSKNFYKKKLNLYRFA